MNDGDKPDDVKNSIKGHADLSNDPTIKLPSEFTEKLSDDSNARQNCPYTKDLIAGTRIKRNVIERLIGKGGMGAVYLAYDEKLQRQVAIKSIRTEYLANPDTQKRFIREAQILSKINHHSICQIYDYIETDDGDFLVLEYIKGKQLYRSSLNHQQTLDVLIDLAEALAVAHQHDVIHRDLKPDNVMINNQGQVKVLDFGIAQSMTSLNSQRAEVSLQDTTEDIDAKLTQKGSLVGTIRYMSPEQARGEVLTPASDIYALGVMALELLSKKPAYQVMETQRLLKDVQMGQLVDVAVVPQAYRELITLLTDKLPENRPSAPEVVSLLKKIKSAPSEKRRQRFRYLVAFFALMAVAVLLWQWQDFSLQKKKAERFANYQTQISDIVKASEQVYALPIHNVRPEINELFKQGTLLANQVRQDELLDEREKNRLYGLIYFEAGSFDLAVKHLEAGEANDAELASAWIGKYIEKAASANSYVQALQSEEMKTAYLNPALTYVERAKSKAQEQGLKQDTWHRAFWVAHKQSFEAAVALLDEILASEAWNKDAVAFKALLLSAMGQEQLESGHWEKSQEYFMATADTYRQAAEMVRSFPENYSRLCAIELSLLVDALQRTSEQFEQFKAQAITACEQHLVTQPETAATQDSLSVIHWLSAQWLLIQGLSADDSIQQAKEWNQRAKNNLVTVTGLRVAAFIELSEAEALAQKGLSVGKHLDESLEIMNGLIKNNPSWEPFLVGDLLLVHSYVMRNQLRLLAPMEDWYQKSLSKYQQVADNGEVMAESQRASLRNLGAIRYWRLLSMKYHGQLSLSDFDDTDAFFQQGIQAMPDEPGLLINYALVSMLKLEYMPEAEMSVRLDAIAAWVAAAQKINQKDNNVKLTHAALSNWQAAISGKGFNESDRFFQALIASAPSISTYYHSWAEAKLIQMRFTTNKSEQGKQREQGLELIAQAIERDPMNQYFLKTQQMLKAWPL